MARTCHHNDTGDVTRFLGCFPRTFQTRRLESSAKVSPCYHDAANTGMFVLGLHPLANGKSSGAHAGYIKDAILQPPQLLRLHHHPTLPVPDMIHSPPRTTPQGLNYLGGTTRESLLPKRIVAIKVIAELNIGVDSDDGKRRTNHWYLVFKTAGDDFIRLHVGYYRPGGPVALHVSLHRFEFYGQPFKIFSIEITNSITYGDVEQLIRDSGLDRYLASRPRALGCRYWVRRFLDDAAAEFGFRAEEALEAVKWSWSGYGEKLPDDQQSEIIAGEFF